MNIGGAWKKESNGKKFLSCQINVPFLGVLNFAIFPVDEKKGNGPDYNIVWSDRPRKDKQEINPFKDDIPF